MSNNLWMFDYCLFVFLAKTPVYASSSLVSELCKSLSPCLWPSSVCAQSLQSCLTLGDPMDYSLPDSSVHGIFQARILDWFAISFSRGSSRPKDATSLSCVSCIGRWSLYHRAIRETLSLQSAHSLMNSSAVHPGMPKASSGQVTNGGSHTPLSTEALRGQANRLLKVCSSLHNNLEGQVWIYSLSHMAPSPQPAPCPFACPPPFPFLSPPSVLHCEEPCTHTVDTPAHQPKVHLEQVQLWAVVPDHLLRPGVATCRKVCPPWRHPRQRTAEALEEMASGLSGQKMPESKTVFLVNGYFKFPIPDELMLL